MDGAIGLLIIALVLGQWVAQYVIGHKLNASRRQSSVWFLWVFFLGWIGVLIIACQQKKPVVILSELTAAVKERDALLAENNKLRQFGLPVPEDAA